MNEIFNEIDSHGFNRFDLSHHKNRVDYDLFKKIIKECNLEDELIEFVNNKLKSKSSLINYPTIMDKIYETSPRSNTNEEINRRNSSTKKIKDKYKKDTEVNRSNNSFTNNNKIELSDKK